MSKIKLLIIAVVGLLIINIGIICFLFFKKPTRKMDGPPGMSQNGRPGRPGMPPMEKDGPKKMIIDRLHFNKEQADDYQKLIVVHIEKIKELNDSIQITKNELYRTLGSNSRGQEDSLINRLGALQIEVELTHYKHFEALKKICKPDQLNDFNKLSNDLASYFAGSKNDGPPPPPGR